MKTLVLILLLISSLFSQVNIEAMRKTNDSSNLELHLDLTLSIPKNTEFTYATRYNYLFDNDAVFLGVLKGEYFHKKQMGSSKILKIKECCIYDTPILLSHFFEAFIQNEFDDFRALENRQLIGGGVCFPLTPLDSMFVGTGAMYEKEVYNLESNLEITELKSTSY